MTNNQENQFSMAKAVQQVLNDSNAIISTIPAFQTTKTDLDAILGDIEVALVSQLGNITGKAQDKNAAAAAAIETAITLVGPAKSYAKASGNNSLFQAFNYTASSLKRLRDAELMNTLVLIGQNLSANVAGLADYGVTEANISSLAQLTEGYGALLTAPRSAITFKSAATASVSEKFGKLRSILARLDGLAAAQKISNAVFFNAYNAARTVVDNKGRAKPKPAVHPAA